MATDTEKDLRREIAHQRDELTGAVEELREELHRAKPPLVAVAAAALGAGFVLGGGIGATARLIFRRRRER
jgi:lipid-binding SYLF domain-containing protein